MRHILLALSACTLSLASHAACPPAPAAVIDIDANSYYMDAHNSVVDPVRRARNIAATKPVEDFLAAVAENASAAQRSGDRERGACALAWLTAWAAADGMLGKMTTNQSYYHRKWTLAGLALSYARVKPLASPAQRGTIDGWLGKLAAATIAHAEDSGNRGARNNHYYWEGLAVAAAGGATGNQRYLDWGRKVFGDAMNQIQPDGSLPREMARAGKALHYHAFSAAPLVMLASLLDAHDERLNRLVRFTVANAKDSAALERTTGFPQEPLNVAKESWLVIHARHAGGTEWRDALPGRYPRLGGDLALPNPLEHVR